MDNLRCKDEGFSEGGVRRLSKSRSSDNRRFDYLRDHLHVKRTQAHLEQACRMSRAASRIAYHQGEALLAKQEFCIYIYHEALMRIETRIREVIFDSCDGGIYAEEDWDEVFDKALARIFAAE